MYMHYEVYIINYTTHFLSRAMFFSMADVLISLLLFSILTFGRRKWAFILTYIFIMIFVTANVIYSRFFGQYITLNVLTIGANLKGTWWTSYISEAFRLSDLTLIASTALFILGTRKLKNGSLFKDAAAIITMLVFSFSLMIVSATREECVSLRSWKQMSEWFQTFNPINDLTDPFQCNQEATIFMNGILRAQLYYNVKLHTKGVSLSETDRKGIGQYIERRNKERLPLSDSCIVEGTPNIVFIVVESYISEASKVVVNGKEITPNINKLMKGKDTYSNLKMTSQRRSGESSDAQVSYFTGLIPLPSELSISYVLRDSIIGLPYLLKTQKGYNTYITLPTPSYFWHQNEANIKYGIDNVIDCVNTETGSWSDDEGLFEVLKTQQLRQPFMHGGYNYDFFKGLGLKSPFIYPKEYSAEFCNYLDKCHYADMQIGKYLEHLKQKGIYDNSIIIITSDHQPKQDLLNMEAVDEALPLIIANSGIPADCFQRHTINQIDLYPTLLDMFNIKSEWRGLGYSILRDGYTPEISPEARSVSDKMLRGNYFAY